jgi:hypothetical protein
MSTFKNIQGKNIRSYANNAPNATAGEMWYNRTELKLKGVVPLAAWASGGTPTVGNIAARAGAGTQTAGLMFGGTTGAPAATRVDNSEEYNGSSFTEGNNLNTARFKFDGCGTQTAAMGASGYESSASTDGTNKVELYDGTSWTEVNNLTRDLYGIYLAGTTTAAVAAGGYKAPPSPAVTDLTQEWDGTNWSNVPATLGTARYMGIGTGTQTAALACLGYAYSPTVTNKTEEYNGTSWTTGGDANTARSALGGCGSQTATIVFGGGPVPILVEVKQKFTMEHLGQIQLI